MTQMHDMSVYLAYRRLDDGRIVGVLPLFWGYGQLVIGRADSLVYDDSWQYSTRDGALLALQEWDPTTQPEPLGYYKRAGEEKRAI
jgi:hypothetical protein